MKGALDTAPTKFRGELPSLCRMVFSGVILFASRQASSSFLLRCCILNAHSVALIRSACCCSQAALIGPAQREGPRHRRKLRMNGWYNQTAWLMISGGKR